MDINRTLIHYSHKVSIVQFAVRKSQSSNFLVQMSEGKYFFNHFTLYLYIEVWIQSTTSSMEHQFIDAHAGHV